MAFDKVCAIDCDVFPCLLDWRKNGFPLPIADLLERLIEAKHRLMGATSAEGEEGRERSHDQSTSHNMCLVGGMPRWSVDQDVSAARAGCLSFSLLLQYCVLVCAIN